MVPGRRSAPVPIVGNQRAVVAGAPGGSALGPDAGDGEIQQPPTQGVSAGAGRPNRAGQETNLETVTHPGQLWGSSPHLVGLSSRVNSTVEPTALCARQRQDEIRAEGRGQAPGSREVDGGLADPARRRSPGRLRAKVQ